MMSILSNLETEDVASSVRSVIYDDNDDDCLKSNLMFLDEKRDILKRVSDLLDSNDIYDASIAKNTDPAGDSALFDEAKEIIATLSRKTIVPRKVSFAPSTKTLEKRKALRNSPRKKARIDISSVEQVSSKTYNTATEKEKTYDDNWMHALEKINNDMVTEGDQKLLIASDSSGALECNIDERGSTLLQLLSAINNTAGSSDSRCYTTMEDALAITDQPQIISQSSHPFLSFHANKAFFALSGMSAKDFVAKPIEDIIGSNCNDGIENVLLAALNNESYTIQSTSNVFHATFGEVKCQIQVKPLSSTEDSVSYLMIQINPSNIYEDAQQRNHVPTKERTRTLVGTVG
eukprot:CAMPEP_0194217874 /NCGR_PEP_ID=MMETSP0156-20130528/22434_1 /TAXON_ID=33649 /ORGANISM="Thalassionema nitzschioides, Strain L26-B" /LENGTH=346 /DNA_ID=CAMNT_0038947027 /DNA_START=1 /DNA_END=1041 /DNA_ORIENTATION=-